MPLLKKVILLIDKSGALGRGLLKGIARYSQLHGHWLVFDEQTFCFSKNSAASPIREIRNFGADGIIMPRSTIKEDILALGLPCIISELRVQMPSIPYERVGSFNILGDDLAAGKMAAEHFLDRGFKNFAFCGHDRVFWSEERASGFTKRIEQAGFTTSIYNQPATRRRPNSRQKQQRVLSQWLNSLPKPAAVMACNDEHARIVLNLCKTAGISVPYEIAVLGVDNDELLCSLANPALSSVALNTERAGYQAAELLDRLMSYETIPYKDIIVQPTIVVQRLSTDTIAIAEPEVKKAVKFITDNATRAISVRDVVESTGPSRREMERRFRKFLGITIHKQIRKARAGQIAKMLAETNLTVSEIAILLGFNGVEHIARYFKKEYGINPTQYRKRYCGK